MLCSLTNCSVQLLLYIDLSIFVACTGQVLPLPSQQAKLQDVTLYKLVIQLLFSSEATMPQAVPHCLACGSVTHLTCLARLYRLALSCKLNCWMLLILHILPALLSHLKLWKLHLYVYLSLWLLRGIGNSYLNWFMTGWWAMSDCIRLILTAFAEAVTVWLSDCQMIIRGAMVYVYTHVPSNTHVHTCTQEQHI